MEKNGDNLKLGQDKNFKILLDPNERILYSDKIHKISPVGWVGKQERIIVITNKFFYNVHKKKVKRKIAWVNIAAVTVSTHKLSAEFVIHIPTEYDYRYTSPKRNQILNFLREIHFKIHAKPLPLYGVPNEKLKEFAMIIKGKKKVHYTIPSEIFRIPESSLPSPKSYVVDDLSSNIDDFEESKNRSKTIYIRTTNEKTATLSDFLIIKKIGKGSFGTVYLVKKNDDGQFFAMKQLRKDVLITSESLECTKLESHILKSTSYPFLVSMDYVFQSPVNVYFVMKYYRGGNLYTHLRKLRRFKESQTRFYAAQVALALGQLHSRHILYRDIKPENILLDTDGYIALADFGLAKIVSSDQSTNTFVGTAEYIAPEIIIGTGHNTPADWWSFGVLLYEMLIGIVPFYSRNQRTMYTYITRKEVAYPDLERLKITLSEEAKDIIGKLLVKKPLCRLGAKGDVEEVLKHPFFKNLDIGKLLNKNLEAEYKPDLDHDTSDLGIEDPSLAEDEEHLIEMADPAVLELIQKHDNDFSSF